HPRLRFHPARRLSDRHILVDLHRHFHGAVLRGALSVGREKGGVDLVRRRWCLAKPLETEAAALQRELGISPLLAALLTNRGIVEPSTADRFLRARLDEHLRSPMLFRDMPAACDRLARALRQGER